MPYLLGHNINLPTTWLGFMIFESVWPLRIQKISSLRGLGFKCTCQYIYDALLAICEEIDINLWMALFRDNSLFYVHEMRLWTLYLFLLALVACLKNAQQGSAGTGSASLTREQLQQQKALIAAADTSEQQKISYLSKQLLSLTISANPANVYDLHEGNKHEIGSGGNAVVYKVQAKGRSNATVSYIGLSRAHKGGWHTHLYSMRPRRSSWIGIETTSMPLWKRRFLATLSILLSCTFKRHTFTKAPSTYAHSCMYFKNLDASCSW